MDMQERITECYNIPENDKAIGEGKTCATARTAIDEAIFKAGQREPFDKDELIIEMHREYEAKLNLKKQAGIREVVEWIMEQGVTECPEVQNISGDRWGVSYDAAILFNIRQELWQAQKKLWGVDGY